MIEIKNGSRGRLIAASLLGATLLAVTACSSEPSSAPAAAEAPAEGENAIYDMLPDSIKESGVILAGGLFQTPPVLGADSADPSVAVGIAPDLAAAMEPVLGVEIEFVDTQWPNQIPGVQAGNLDVLWGQISDNAERERSAFDFVPFMAGVGGLLIPAENPEGIDSIASMCGLTMAVANGSNTAEIVSAVSDEACVAAGQDPIELIALQGGADAYAAVKAGTTDAWYDSYSSIAQVAETDDFFGAVELDIEETPLEMRNFNGIAVLKDNAGLTEALYAAMGEIRDSGDYQAVFDEWGVGTDVIQPEYFRINPFTDTPVGETAE
ncbi:transporter substrate-binding domain-containing protein [Microbacter sp. GSS18]|nr:transporter substrate-binding domain-containing protein [Microbacter sp. GSS18]